MIDVQHLVKWYGPTLAVDDISFHIPKGQIVGFLGPNGAGKSTTLRILTGYIPPTAGLASIDGHDLLTASKSARSRVGYLPESTPLYLEMRAEEYLDFRGKLMGMPRKLRRQRIDIVCDRCGLKLVRRRLIGQLSRGNRQRVGLAQALLHDPPVLVLDEPTAGLDPNQIGEVRKLITELRGEHTILLSTHILPEVEKMADDVMIIARGRIVARGTPDELRRQVSKSQVTLFIEVKAPPEQVSQAIEALDSVARVQTQETGAWTTLHVQPRDHADPREAIGRLMLARQWPLREMRYEVPSLEQLFVQITAEQAQAKSA